MECIIILKLFKVAQHIVHSKPPVSKRLSAAIYCSAVPLIVSVPLHNWNWGCLLWNIVVILFSEYTAADIN
jgi:hypothetical protein